MANSGSGSQKKRYVPQLDIRHNSRKPEVNHSPIFAAQKIQNNLFEYGNTQMNFGAREVNDFFDEPDEESKNNEVIDSTFIGQWPKAQNQRQELPNTLML